MNLFRFLGNVAHVGANAYLIQRIRQAQSVRGISLKTCQLALLAFVTRYMDILHPGGFFQFWLRIASVATAGYTLLLFKVFGTSRYGGYDANLDSASRLYLIVPCAILGLLFHYRWLVTHVAAEFATFLEAVSVWPQLTMLHNLPAATIPAPMGNGSIRDSTSPSTRVLFDANAIPTTTTTTTTGTSPTTTLPTEGDETDQTTPTVEPVVTTPTKTLSPQELEPTLIDRNYLFLLATYRLLYFPGWLYRYLKVTALDPIEMVATGVGIALLVDLFHLYYTKFAPNRTYEVPI